MSDPAVDAFARLVAHWPNIGGDDAFAEVRAQDWLEALRSISRPGQAIDHIVNNWTENRAPRIGDLTEAAETNVRLYGEILGGYEPVLPPAPTSSQSEQVHELVGLLRAVVPPVPATPQNPKPLPRAARKGPGRTERHTTLTQRQQADTPDGYGNTMLRYDDVYDAEGKPRPDYETERWVRVEPH